MAQLVMSAYSEVWQNFHKMQEKISVVSNMLFQMKRTLILFLTTCLHVKMCFSDSSCPGLYNKLHITAIGVSCASPVCIYNLFRGFPNCSFVVPQNVLTRAKRCLRALPPNNFPAGASLLNFLFLNRNSVATVARVFQRHIISRFKLFLERTFGSVKARTFCSTSSPASGSLVHTRRFHSVHCAKLCIVPAPVSLRTEDWLPSNCRPAVTKSVAGRRRKGRMRICILFSRYCR